MLRIFLSLLIITSVSCTVNINKYSDDPMIIMGLEQIKKSNQKNILSYLLKYPAGIYFNPVNNENCIKIKSTGNNNIFIPFYSRSSNLMIEANTVKALYYYRVLNNYKLSDIFYEIELLSSYAQMEYILTNYTPDDIKKDEFFNKNMIDKICAYILSPKTFDKLIYDNIKITDYPCGYPLEDMNYYENYYNQLKTALTSIEGDAFFNLIYQKYMEKVKRGEITREEAEKRYYYLLSEPLQELYREQRVYITENIRAISRFKKFYNREIKIFHKNAEQKKGLTENFPQCLESNQE